MIKPVIKLTKLTKREQVINMINKWLLGISLGGLIGCGGVLVGQAATHYTVKPVSTTAKQAYLTASTTGKLYQFNGTNEHLTLKPVHQLANFPHTKWTRIKRSHLTKNGKTYLYYYVKNKTGKTGWVWHGYLKPTGMLKLNVPLIAQRPELPTGCEIVATTMMLQYAGSKATKLQVTKRVPRSTNPKHGFVSSPYNNRGHGHYVYPEGLLTTVKHYLGTAVDLTGSRLPQLKRQLNNDHPIVTWMAGLDGFNTHSVTVTGYSKTQIMYNDPWTNRKTSLTNAQFLKYWQRNHYRALSY